MKGPQIAFKWAETSVTALRIQGDVIRTVAYGDQGVSIPHLRALANIAISETMRWSSLECVLSVIDCSICIYPSAAEDNAVCSSLQTFCPGTHDQVRLDWM
jgi:hypothetical protein